MIGFPKSGHISELVWIIYSTKLIFYVIAFFAIKLSLTINTIAVYLCKHQTKMCDIGSYTHCSYSSLLFSTSYMQEFKENEQLISETLLWSDL